MISNKFYLLYIIIINNQLKNYLDMFEKKKLAIIPARWGSKWITKKNIVNLAWKPLIVYSIEAAINSKCFDKICLATDSLEIIDVVSEFNIEVIKLPSNLTTDDSKMIDVILYILDYYKEKNQNFELSMLLQPTSPLRTYIDIQKSFKEYLSTGAYNSLVSFCETNEHPYKSFLYENNEIKPSFWEEYVSLPRQLLPKTIQQNWAIYINRVEDLIRNKIFFTKPVLPFIMNDISSIDIDKEIDLLFAEFCINNTNKNVNS